MSQTTFFESIGRSFFEKGRLWRLLALFALPLVLVHAALLIDLFALENTEMLFQGAAGKAKSALTKKAQKEQFLARYEAAQPFFIPKSLETLEFCRSERERLRQWADHPACPSRETIEARLLHLEQNRLAFAEEAFRSSGRVKESEEKLLKAVELDRRDLEQLLALIENQQIGDSLPDPRSPQLQILEIDLMFTPSNVLLSQLTLLKREWRPHETAP